MSQPESQPLREATSRKIFCVHCVSETTDDTPGNISGKANIMGRIFYGSAEPCTECASVIRTLWWTVANIPVVPLGSYRYKIAKEGTFRTQFWCRKLPALRWGQVWKTWAIGLVLGVAGLIAIYYWKIK
jgi:hypothetical protein